MFGEKIWIGIPKKVAAAKAIINPAISGYQISVEPINGILKIKEKINAQIIEYK